MKLSFNVFHFYIILDWIEKIGNEPYAEMVRKFSLINSLSVIF